MTPPAPHGPPTSAASTVSAMSEMPEMMSTRKASERARWTSREIIVGCVSGSCSCFIVWGGGSEEERLRRWWAAHTR